MSKHLVPAALVLLGVLAVVRLELAAVLALVAGVVFLVAALAETVTWAAGRADRLQPVRIRTCESRVCANRGSCTCR